MVLVHYTITLEVDSSGITNDTLDFISLQNNLVEKNYPGAAEQPTVVYTITDFRNYITEALHKDNFMTNSSLESQSDPLLLENGTVLQINYTCTNFICEIIFRSSSSRLETLPNFFIIYYYWYSLYYTTDISILVIDLESNIINSNSNRDGFHFGSAQHFHLIIST